MIWTPPQLVNWISNDFKEKGLPPPHRYQAELLVSHALGISRIDIYLQHDKPSTPEEQLRLREFVKRRYRREPVSYIIGTCDFWSLKLIVGPGVLTPRADTEVLVETILSKIQQNTDQKQFILELGTGSGAIPLALASERENLHLVCIDFSKIALDYAVKNAQEYQSLLKSKNNQISFVRTDKFSSIKKRPYFDFIVSNPPYIPRHDIDSLQHEVRDWEPREALEGGKEGLDFYRYLLEACKELLKPDGFLIFEHGYDQAMALEKLVRETSGVKLLEKIKDYSNNDRVMTIQKLTSS